MKNRMIKIPSILTVILIMTLICGTVNSGTKTAAAAAKLPQTGNTVTVPEKYQKQAKEKGTIKKLTYRSKDYAGNGSVVEKAAYVYLPYGYKQKDAEKKYNVLYLMHGWGDQAGKFFEHGTIRNMFDNMIQHGDMPPMIIVSPTFYTKNSDTGFDGSVSELRQFHKDFVKHLMPAVEGKYHTYAESTSKKDLKASRDHRAFGGFSLGAVTTWMEFCYDADYIRYYLPMSGSCWYYGGYKDYHPKKTCRFFKQMIKEKNLDKRGYFIYAATGTADEYQEQMDIQMQEMFRNKKLFSANNTVYYKKNGGKHDFTAVQEYLYNALPHFFHDLDEPEKPAVYAVTPEIRKASEKAIKIAWDSSQDNLVRRYYVMRRKIKNNKAAEKWKIIARIKSSGTAGDSVHLYTDHLNSSAPQQYEYKICILSIDKNFDTSDRAYDDETDKYAALGSNIKICIDPGHFGSRNNNYQLDGKDGKYPYSEAKFTLKIGKELQKELKLEYGIDSYMTRTSRNISLTYNGKTYTNKKLDDKNIAIRGYMAKKEGCDFFISLHTNMKGSAENPWNQPDSLNKVYVFVNSIANESNRGMKISNVIGAELTAYNQKAGIQTAKFTERSRAADYSSLSSEIPVGNGTVVHRKNYYGSDYYGVLRGASRNGTEGILVEHAFHDTRIMRKYANSSHALYENWAACDAYGIAKGFGFAK